MWLTVVCVNGEPSLGTRIQRARGRLRVTLGRRVSQEELARMVGASRSAVNAWENDRAVPSEEAIGALEAVLGDLSSPDGQEEQYPEGSDEAMIMSWPLPLDKRRAYIAELQAARRAARPTG